MVRAGAQTGGVLFDRLLRIEHQLAKLQQDPYEASRTALLSFAVICSRRLWFADGSGSTKEQKRAKPPSGRWND